MHYYQHNIKSFNSATRHLTRVERSLYRDLIELYYDTEQPLPADDFDRLARRVMAVSEEEKQALTYVLSEFFEKTGDVWSHDKCDEELDKYREAATAKSRAGKASAEARRKKAEARKGKRKGANEQDLTDVEQPLNTCSTDEQLTNNHKPLTNNHKPRASASQDSNGVGLSENPPRAPGKNHAGKFAMTSDWSPEPETWRANLFKSNGKPYSPEQLHEFQLYWQGESVVFTESQWQGKFIQSLKRQAAKRLPEDKKQSLNDAVSGSTRSQWAEGM